MMWLKVQGLFKNSFFRYAPADTSTEVRNMKILGQ